jgi:hypothetical protein
MAETPQPIGSGRASGGATTSAPAGSGTVVDYSNAYLQDGSPNPAHRLWCCVLSLLAALLAGLPGHAAGGCASSLSLLRGATGWDAGCRADVLVLLVLLFAAVVRGVTTHLMKRVACLCPCFLQSGQAIQPMMPTHPPAVLPSHVQWSKRRCSSPLRLSHACCWLRSRQRPARSSR